jgi:hypothetical protein
VNARLGLYLSRRHRTTRHGGVQALL